MASNLTPLFAAIGDGILEVQKRTEKTVETLKKAGYEVSGGNIQWINSYERIARESEVLSAKIQTLVAAKKKDVDIQAHLGPQIERMAKSYAAIGKPLDDAVQRQYDMMKAAKAAAEEQRNLADVMQREVQSFERALNPTAELAKK